MDFLNKCTGCFSCIKAVMGRRLRPNDRIEIYYKTPFYILSILSNFINNPVLEDDYCTTGFMNRVSSAVSSSNAMNEKSIQDHMDNCIQFCKDLEKAKEILNRSIDKLTSNKSLALAAEQFRLNTRQKTENRKRQRGGSSTASNDAYDNIILDIKKFVFKLYLDYGHTDENFTGNIKTTMYTVNRMVDILKANHRWEEANEMLCRSYFINANAHKSNRRWEEAYDMFLSALMYNDMAGGLDEQEMGIAMGGLADVLINMGRGGDAVLRLRHELDIYEKKSDLKHGLYHPHTVITMNTLADVLNKMGQWKESKEMYHLSLIHI